MPFHAERRFLPYPADKMFGLVADIERYPEFLPWCVGARILGRDGPVIRADLMVGFRMIRETFTSRVTLSPPERIEVEYERGPFRHLTNRWIFHAAEGGCEIEFYIDFEFRSRLLRTVMGPLFHEAVRRMVSAFEGRAAAIYGAPGGADRAGAGA